MTWRYWIAYSSVTMRSVAAFEIDLARLDELFDLLATQIDRSRQIPGAPLYNKTVAMGFHLSCRARRLLRYDAA